MNINKNLKISVVISTCNRPELLSKAIKSVLNQTFQDFEIVVVDDGLKRRANKVIENINDDRIIYIQNKENKGGSATRNVGIKNTKTDWVAFLDDDDEWNSEKLQKQYEAIEKYGNKIGFVFCGAEFHNQQNNNVKIKKYDSGEMIKNYYEQCIALNFKVYTPTLIVRKGIFLKAGYFSEDLPSNQETELMMRITKISEGYCVNDNLVKVNFLDGEHIGGNINRRIMGKILTIQKHQEELEKRPGALSKHYYVLGDLYRIANDFKKARKCYKKSWRNNKTQIKALIMFMLLSNYLLYKLAINTKDIIKNN